LKHWLLIAIVNELGYMVWKHTLVHNTV